MNKIFFFLLLFSCFKSQAQKRFSEGSIRYEVSMKTPQNSVVSKADFIQMAKGSHYRSELSNEFGKTTTIFDNKEGDGCILREYGAQKIMIPINRTQWDKKAGRNENLQFNFSDETKEINGYTCHKASTLMGDSSSIIVFFTKEIIPEASGMELQFSQLPGIVLEYKSIKKNIEVTYVASSINFEPVPIQKFDQPKSGYRILGFDESNKVK
jgi:GLPGLI family protein